MSDASDSTLKTIRALIDAFKKGATPSATSVSAAEAAWVPPPFPVPAKDEKQGEVSEYGRLPSSKTQTEGNYARQRLEDLARGQSQQPDEKPVTDCAGSLHISLFFDGTCCNEKDADDVYGSPKPALTNIGKLYHAANWTDQAKKAEADGYFSYYFPGCGARFPQIGEDDYSLDGELFANGGEDRISQALLKTFSSIVYAVTHTSVEDSALGVYRQKMATNWPFSVITKGFNRKNAITEFCDTYLGKVVTQWPLQPTREFIHRAQKRIPKIKLFVYGYCRGAATARAFACGLEALLDKTPMPLNATSMAPKGSVLPSGPTLLGIPVSIDFLGLMDSVSSVGVPHILPSATGHLGWAANSLQLPKTAGLVKSCCHFVAGLEQHGDLPLDSIRRPDGKYPTGAVEVVYPGVHADIGGDCKPTELGKVQTDSRQLLSQIALHDMYAAAFDAGAPLSVPLEVLPDVVKDKTYRIMRNDILRQFKISAEVITHFNAWQAITAQKEASKTAEGAINEAEIAAIAVAQGKDPDQAVQKARASAAKKAEAARKKSAETRNADKLPAAVYVPLKAKALEVILADHLSWITAWRTERFASPEHAARHYTIQPFYQQARNDDAELQADTQPAQQGSSPRDVPLIDRDRLDRAAGQYDFSHTGIMALLALISLDVIPGTATDQLGGKLIAAQDAEFLQIKKNGDARRPALMTSPQMMDFFDNYVHDTVAKYNHDPLHSSLTHGYFSRRTVYDTDDDNWDSVKQFGQRINAVVDINIGDIVTQVQTDLAESKTVSGILGKIYRDIKNGAFKALLS